MACGGAGASSSALYPSEAVFDLIDFNHDGFISRDEWSQAMHAKHASAAGAAQHPSSTTTRSPSQEKNVLDDDSTDRSSVSALRPGQKRKFPSHWGVPPLMQTRDYVVWPDGYGAGSSTVAAWIADNIRRDSGKNAVPQHLVQQGGDQTAGNPLGASARALRSTPQLPQSSFPSQSATAASCSPGAATPAAALPEPVATRSLALPFGGLSARGAPTYQATPQPQHQQQVQQAMAQLQQLRTPRNGTRTPPAGAAHSRSATPPREGSLPPAALWSHRSTGPPSSRTDLTAQLGRPDSMVHFGRPDPSAQRAELESAIESARRARLNDAMASAARPSTGSPKSARWQVASRDDLSGSRGLAARIGAATARKVAEIERLLVEELEQTLVIKAGFISSCLHNWRRLTSLSQMERIYQDDQQRAHSRFRVQMAHKDFVMQQEMDAVRKQHLEANRCQRALLLDRRREGDAKAWLRQVLLCWHAVSQRQHHRRTAQTHARTFDAIVTRFAEGALRGLLEATYHAWVEILLAANRKEFTRTILEWVALQWDDVHEQHLLKATWSAWMVRAKIATGVLSKLMKNAIRGLLAAGMRGWIEFCRLHANRRQVHDAMACMAARWMEQQATALVRMVFHAWHQHHAGESRARMLEDQRRGLEELCSAQQDDWERSRQAAETAAQAARLNAVQLVVRKWELGHRKGLTMQVWQSWSTYAKHQGVLGRARQAVHVSVQRWLEGRSRSCLGSAYQAWKDEWANTSKVRQLEMDLERQRQELCSNFEAERVDIIHQFELHKSAAQAAAEELDNALEFTLATALKGDLLGLAAEILHVWFYHCNVRRRLAAKQHSIQTALVVAADGRDRTEVDHAFISWRSSVQKAKAKREGHRAMEASIAKWLDGAATGMLKVVMTEWQDLLARARRQESVHLAVLKSLAVADASTLQSVFQGWLHYCVIGKALEEANSSYARELRVIEGRLSGMEKRAHQQLERFSAAVAVDDDVNPLYLKTVFALWRAHTHGVCAKELEQRLVKQQEVSKLRKERSKANIAKTVHMLGTVRDKSLLGEVFVQWSTDWKTARLEMQQRTSKTKWLGRLGSYMGANRTRQDTHSLAQSVLWEFHKIARAERRAAENEHINRHMDEQDSWVVQLEHQRAGLEEQLWMAYKQIDQITETLQKELRTKEELASELRDAYDKMRRSNFPIGGTPPLLSPYTALHEADPGSRPGSASSRARPFGGIGAPRRDVASREVPPLAPQLPVDNSAPRLPVSRDLPCGIPRSLMWDGGAEPTARTAPLTEEPYAPTDRSLTFNPRAVLDGLNGAGAPGDLGTSSCTWNDAVTRMTSEGLLHLGPP